MNIEFALPWIFWLLPLPMLAALLLPRASVETPSALRVPFFKAMSGNLTKQSQQRSRFWLLLAIIAWLSLLISAARPQLIGETISMPVSGRSLMMAVDISGSMQNHDMAIRGRSVSRLAAVKAVASEFIQQREGDRIGLILFGSNAYLQAPLTLDRKTVSILLEEAALGLAGRQTAIGDAIGLSVKRLREQPKENRVLILLTDGANTEGSIDPLKAADLAAQENVRIYTIGVGAEGEAISTPFGIQRRGRTDLDEPTLRDIASKTSGEYFRARDVESLQKVYALLDKIEPLSKDDLTYRPVDELYQWPLSLALLLSVLVMLGVSGVFKKMFARLIPSRDRRVSRGNEANKAKERAHV